MELSFLTFIVTNDCNFNCAYCFQEKDKTTIAPATIEKAVEFFYPFLKQESTVDFYGGEPLLAFDRVRHTVACVLEKNKHGNKKIQFNLTTNGSLITDEILEFFAGHRFGLLLSFDGLAQEQSRKAGTLHHIVKTLEHFRFYPGIDLEINSVFTPRTVASLTGSVRFLVESGCSNITFNIDTMEEWRPEEMETFTLELNRLTDYLAALYRETGNLPVSNFRGFIPGNSGTGDRYEKKRGIFRCYAAKDRVAVTPEGKLWGCYLFHDFFKSRKDHPQYGDYYLGTLEEFISAEGKLKTGVAGSYSELRMDYFQAEQGYCFLCKEVAGCVVCPVNAAYSSGSLGKIPRRVCELIKIQRNAQEEFRQKLSLPDPAMAE